MVLLPHVNLMTCFSLLAVIIKLTQHTSSAQYPSKPLYPNESNELVGSERLLQQNGNLLRLKGTQLCAQCSGKDCTNGGIFLMSCEENEPSQKWFIDVNNKIKSVVATKFCVTFTDPRQLKTNLCSRQHRSAQVVTVEDNGIDDDIEIKVKGGKCFSTLTGRAELSGVRWDCGIRQTVTE